MKAITINAAILSTALFIQSGAVNAEDEYFDGVANEQGQAIYKKWLKDPATPDKINRVTSGKAYMAKELKLNPGDYTVTEMGRIQEAGSNESARKVIMMQITGERPKPATYVSRAEASLARSLGVDPRDYTLTELARMKFAQDD